MCNECAIMQLGVCLQDKEVPMCVNPNCKLYYVLSDYKDEHARDMYSKCCFYEMIEKHGDMARKIYEIETAKETLVNLRKQFIQERFPKAIVLTAGLIMQKKINKVNKALLEKYENDIFNSNRVCMNLTCNGSLNDNFVCMTCDTAFCKQCEKHFTQGHKCNEDDIASLKEINNFTHCPGCGLAIERAQGCTAMTCASCKTSFNYLSGERQTAGSHNPEVVVKDKLLLSSVYKDFFIERNLLSDMLEIEALEPKKKDNTGYTRPFTKYYKNANNMTPTIAFEVAKMFEKQLLTSIKIKQYQKALNEINHKIINKTLRDNDMKTILNFLRKHQ